MPRTRNPHLADFRERIVELAGSRRSVDGPARAFEPCAATIHGWIKQAERDDGHRSGGLTGKKRDVLRRLRARYPGQGRNLVCSKRRDVVRVRILGLIEIMGTMRSMG